MSCHFERCHNQSLNKFRYYGIKHIHAHPRGGEREKELRKQESGLLIALGTETPQGRNADTELYVHL